MAKLKYLYGEDVYEARHLINQLAGEAQIRWLDLQEARDNLSEALTNSSGLFGEVRVVLKDATSWPKELQAEVLDTAENVIIWDRGKPDKRSLIWKNLGKSGQELKAKTMSELISWLGLGPSVGKELVARVGSDRWRLENEIKKLELGGKISRERVKAEVESEVINDNVFEMLDCLIGNKKPQALHELEKIWSAGHSEFYVLSMLAYQFRLLWQIKNKDTAGLSSYAVGKARGIAERLDNSQIKTALVKILATDTAIRQGKIKPREAVTMLIVSLLG